MQQSYTEVSDKVLVKWTRQGNGNTCRETIGREGDHWQIKLNELFPEGPPAAPPLGVPPSIPPEEPELPPLPEMPVDPAQPDLPTIPTLPVELPVDLGDLPEDDDEDDGPPFPLPEPVEGQPGRP
ncbi:MAG: hypothetical protein IBX69_11085 [Anaerolineales bacterium]|nr:hypothetical protein [Anaerolineales bacterium]